MSKETLRKSTLYLQSWPTYQCESNTLVMPVANAQKLNNYLSM